MKFTLVEGFDQGEDFDESDYYGICVAILSRFKDRIPNWRLVKFDSILPINSRDRCYEVNLDYLEGYGIPRREIVQFMAEFGSVPIEEGLTAKVLR